MHFAVSLSLTSLLVMAPPAEVPVAEIPIDALPEVDTWELFATPALMAGGLIPRYTADMESTNWRGGILFDEAAIDAFSVRSPTYRDVMTPIGDIGWPGLPVLRFIEDWAVAGIYHGRWDLAWRMFLIDVEAYAISAAILFPIQALVRRERPRTRFCRTEPGYDAIEPGGCDPEGDNRSFISGHLAAATTGAALTCLHHANLPLYGGGAADTGACVFAITAATATGVARITMDAHYASDVILGAGLGLLTGWLVPKVLHYSEENDMLVDSAPLGVDWIALAPSYDGASSSLTVLGAF